MTASCCNLCATWKLATAVAVSMFSLTATQAWSQPVPGTLDVHWNEGASDCTATTQDPLQVHTYEPQTFILRQSPCATFEANFLYLLVSSDKALLIDTGAVADPKQMPLAKTILDLLPIRITKSFPPVAHTTASRSRAGDSLSLVHPHREPVLPPRDPPPPPSELAAAA